MNVSEVRSFLGLTGYYRRFMQGFSSIMMSMTKFLQKYKKFEWDNECKASFTKLKTRLTTAPILTLPSRTDGSVIYGNTFSKELCYMLIQHGKLVAYASLQLRPYEKNY